MASMITKTPKRFTNSPQSSSLLTSTPVNSRPIQDTEPVQSPIEQNSKNQGIFTPAHARRSSRIQTSLNETSSPRYRTRSQSRILDASCVLNLSGSISKNLLVSKNNTPLKLNASAEKDKLLVPSTAGAKSVKVKPPASGTTETKSHSNSRGNTKDRRRSRTVDGSEININSRKISEEKENVIARTSLRNNKLSGRRISVCFQELVHIGKHSENFDIDIHRVIGGAKANAKFSIVQQSNPSTETREMKQPTPTMKNDRSDILVPKTLQANKFSANAKTYSNSSTVSEENLIKKCCESKSQTSLNNGKTLSSINESKNTSANGLNKTSTLKKLLAQINKNINSKTIAKPNVHNATPDDSGENMASGDSSHSTSNRSSDQFYSNSSSKPSFIRRKLYSRSSDFADLEQAVDKKNCSFLEKKDIRSVYSLKNKETSKISKPPESDDTQNVNSILRDKKKGGDNLRHYCLRKNNTKNFNKYFGDTENLIPCELKDGNPKEDTSKFVTNVLKDIDKKKSNNKVISALDRNVTQACQVILQNMNISKDSNNKESDLNDSIFEIFSKKENANIVSGKLKKADEKNKAPKKTIQRRDTKNYQIDHRTKEKQLVLPKRRSRDKAKITDVKLTKNNKIAHKSSNEVVRNTKSNDVKSLVIQKERSYILRSDPQKAIECLENSGLDSVLSSLQTSDLLRNSISSKNNKKRSLEISVTTETVLRHKKRKESKEDHGKGNYVTSQKPVIDSNDTIVFKNGKLVSGKFGESSSLNLISPKRMYNLSKANYKNLYQRFDDFDSFETCVNQSLIHPTSSWNYKQKHMSFANRNATNIAKETRQTLEHSKHLFKNPSNVLWNSKPSIEYRVCGGAKQSTSSKYGWNRSASTISTKQTHSARNSESESMLSVHFPKNSVSFLKMGQEYLNKTKTFNEQMIRSSLKDNSKNLKSFSYHKEGYSKIPGEKFAIPYSSRIKMSHTNNGSKNLNDRVSEFNDYEDAPFQLPREYTDTLATLRKYGSTEKTGNFNATLQIPDSMGRPFSTFGESVSEFGDYEEDPLSIPVERSKKTLPNPLRKHTNYPFGESCLDFDNYRDSRERPRNTFPNPSRETEQFVNRASNVGKFKDSLYTRPMGKSRNTFSDRSFHPQNDTVSINNKVDQFTRHRNNIDLPHSSHNRNTTGVVGCISDDHHKTSNFSSSTFKEPKFVDYSESEIFKIPMERTLKRKIIHRDFNEIVSENKRSRIEDSNFSTSTAVPDSSKVCKFLNSEKSTLTTSTHTSNKSVCTFILKSSTVSHPARKILENVSVMNVSDDDFGKKLASNIMRSRQFSDDNNTYNSKSNCFSDNEHEDTVISRGDLPLNNPSHKLNQIAQKTKPEKCYNEVAKSTKKYVICDDEVLSITKKKSEDRNFDDDTFFFKGSFSKPTCTNTKVDRMQPEISKFANFSIPIPRIECSKSLAENKYTSLHSRGSATASHSRLDANFTVKKYTINPNSAVASSSSDTFHHTNLSTPNSKSKSIEDNHSQPVNRAVNCSPWRFSNW